MNEPVTNTVMRKISDSFSDLDAAMDRLNFPPVISLAGTDLIGIGPQRAIETGCTPCAVGMYRGIMSVTGGRTWKL